MSSAAILHKLPSSRLSNTLLWAVVSVVLSASTNALADTHLIVDQVDVANYQHILDDLLYTHPGDNRGYGKEHDLARANIVSTFESYSLDVSLDPFQYNSTTYYNVVAVKLGSTTPDQQYIIGAHYDSVGNPGADDDGSGTAGIMEIARVLSQYDFNSTIIFIAFDREEQGLIGSNAYATEHAIDDIRGMVEMDMIAYNNGNDLVDIYGRSASNGIKTALAQAVSEYSNLSYSIGGGSDNSDHAPFEWQGFEACLIIEDWGNPYYHTPNDHVEMPDYIDYLFAEQITRSVCGWLVDSAGLVTCSYDLDGDNEVTTADLLVLFSLWGTRPNGPPDFNGDGIVNTNDLLILFANWGPCK